MIDRTGEWWRGSEPRDLEEYLREFTAEEYPMDEFRMPTCECGSSSFFLDADPHEGAAKRTCTACGAAHFVCDSEEYWEDAEPVRCACTCGNEAMNLGVGFALYPDSTDVKWLYIGCRCTSCGVLGCFADWKIGYGPSNHLLVNV